MPRIARALLAAALLALTVAAPAVAADPVLPRPTAEVTFLEGISVGGPATITSDVVRLEVVVNVEGSDRSFVAESPLSIGQVELGYTLPTPGGSYLPNTDLTFRFRATMADGRLVDGPSTTVRYEDTRLDWQVRTGEFVTVHWTEGGAAFGARALEIADRAVAEISETLGVTEADPIDFYVYADRDEFYDVIGPGSRENVGGQAHPEIRTLFANITPDIVDDPWVGIVIPHELSHLVFDTAVDNDYHFPPRWLNEGVAVYLSEGYGVDARLDVERAIARDGLMPLGALAGQFPTTAEQFGLAYSESVSAVEFLIRHYGEDALFELIDVYAEGVTDDEAFTRALGTDVAGFEAAWFDDLGTDPPTAHGPVDAPAGPVPPGWEGEGPVASEIPTGSGDPAPTGGPPPTPSGGESPTGGGVDGTWLLVALLVGGVALAGMGLWLQRRETRPVADGGAAGESVSAGEMAPPGEMAPAGSEPTAADAPDVPNGTDVDGEEQGTEGDGDAAGDD